MRRRDVLTEIIARIAVETAAGLTAVIVAYPLNRTFGATLSRIVRVRG